MKKQFRIKKNETIKAVLNKRDARKDGFFSVFKKKNNLTHFRYAISVPSKYGTAVKRNRIKRQLRMILQSLHIEDSVDIFIIVHQKADTLNYWQQKTKIQHLLKRHGIAMNNSQEVKTNET